MMSLLFFSVIVFGVLFLGLYADIYPKLDESVEDIPRVDQSDILQYGNNKNKYYKSGFEDKYTLRFDPSALKQNFNLTIPNLPSTGYPDFNLEEFDDEDSNSNEISNEQQQPPSTNIFPPFLQNIPPMNGLNNRFNNTLFNPLNNPLTPSILPTNNFNLNNVPPPIIPNSLLNQTNNLLNGPIQPLIPLYPSIASQSIRPGGFPAQNLRPNLQNTFVQNVPLIQPIIATLPQPGFAASVIPAITQTPQTIQDTFSLIGNRFKNLFFGAGPTFIRKPESGRGFLNLFDVIKFQNGPCVGSLNRIRLVNGTCFYKTECLGRGGVIAGVCAAGYGVCCIFKYGCGAQTKEEISYLESPYYPLPSSDPLTCAFVVYLQPGVRQVKLDLLFFELKRPLAGNCLEDQFVVSGQNKNFLVPTICGINSGQHLYIDVDQAPEGKLQLSIVGRNAGARAFSIRVTQLRYYLAPRFCLQYYTEPTGYIKSFNYDNIGSVVEDRVASYFNNLNYAICIDRVQDKCDVTFTNEVAEGELQFQLLNINDQGVPTIGLNQAGADVFSCGGDYIAVNSVRLCGWKLNDGSVLTNPLQNAPITEYGAGPVVIPFQTDENFVGRGFKLMYYQESCI